MNWLNNIKQKLSNFNHIIILMLIFLAIIPWISSTFYLILYTEILLMSILALGFNLLFSYGGLLSFGQAAYFATGAYTSGFLIKASFPFLLSIIIGTLSGFILAFILGYFSVRLNEIYFAMLTLAWGMMTYTIIFQWREVTGGSDGLTGIKIHQLQRLGVTLDWHNFTNYYYLCLLLFILVILFLWRIINSPFGEILQASRDNYQRLQFIGVNIKNVRWLAFTIAGGIAALSGALWSPFQRVASPEIAHWTFSAMPVLMTILGGYHRFFSPVIGASLFLLMEHFIQSNQRYLWQNLSHFHFINQPQIDLWNLLLGCFLIIIILDLPKVIFTIFIKFQKWLKL